MEAYVESTVVLEEQLVLGLGRPRSYTYIWKAVDPDSSLE